MGSPPVSEAANTCWWLRIKHRLALAVRDVRLPMQVPCRRPDVRRNGKRALPVGLRCFFQEPEVDAGLGTQCWSQTLDKDRALGVVLEGSSNAPVRDLNSKQERRSIACA
jgi:hypothetical protein